jgi:hypothetical protein
VLGSGLLSTGNACGSTTLVDCYVICATSSSTVGAGLRLLSAGPPTVSQSSPSPGSTGSDEGISWTTQKSFISIQNTSNQVLDYSTRGSYLLRCSLGHLQFLGDTLACHIARPPWRCRETGLQASRRIFDKRDVGQSRSAEPGPQPEPLLKRLPVLLVRGVFYGDSVVTLADFTALLPLPLPSSGISTS